MDAQILHELGLSKNEIEVYIKLLRLASATGFEVSKEAKLHRANVYDALDRLVKRGLVSHATVEGVKYYKAIDPEQLMTLLKDKEKELEKIIPQLKALQSTAKRSANVMVLEGMYGVRRALTEVLNNSKNEFYALGVPKEMPILAGESWIRNWHAERIKRKVLFHHIVNEDYYPHRIKLLRKLKYTTIKFLPKQYSAPNALMIYDKGITLLFVEPLLAIKILSEDVAKSFRQYYLMLDKLALKKAPQE